MILLCSDFFGYVCVLETCGIISLSFTGRWRKVSIQVLNFAFFTHWSKISQEDHQVSIVHISVVTTNTLIIYTITVNTQEMAVPSALETAQIHC